MGEQPTSTYAGVSRRRSLAPPLKAIASILPRELSVAANPMDGWSDVELEAAIRELDKLIKENWGINLGDPAGKREIN